MRCKPLLLQQLIQDLTAGHMLLIQLFLNMMISRRLHANRKAAAGERGGRWIVLLLLVQLLVLLLVLMLLRLTGASERSQGHARCGMHLNAGLREQHTTIVARSAREPRRSVDCRRTHQKPWQPCETIVECKWALSKV